MTGSHARALSLGCFLAAVSACKFGGPSGDPSAYLEFPSDAQADAGTGDDEAAAPAGDERDAGEARDATAPSDSGALRDAAGPSDDAGSSGEAGLCTVTVPVCDPVANTGCDPLHQCDIDTSQKVPTGVCIFASVSEGGVEAGACTATVFTESCPVKFACVAGACRHPCHCDADCTGGETCSDPSGPGGFTLCKAP